MKLKVLQKNKMIKSIGIFLLLLITSCGLYHHKYNGHIFFEDEKEDVRIMVDIDTTNWLSTITITNLADSVVYIYPLFSDVTATSIHNANYKKLKFYNFSNNSSIEFPVVLVPIMPNSSVSIDLSLNFLKGNVKYFNDFSEIHVITNVMQNFSKIDTFNQHPNGNREVLSIEYDRFSDITRFKFSMHDG
jgi:hypothetical protein